MPKAPALDPAIWEATAWRYGLVYYTRADRATIKPTMTAGGNVKWEAHHPRAGIACSSGGYPKTFSSANVAHRWILAQDERFAPR